MKFLSYRLIGIVFTFPAWALFSHCTDATGRSAVSEPAKMDRKEIFFDDFSGPGLDTSKWNVEITGMHFNNELQAYVDSVNVLQFVSGTEAEGAENGAALFTPGFVPGYTTGDGRKFDFISSRINTRNKAEFTYGTVSARIKLTEGAGLWPAFWILGTGQWPETGEIDVMEYVGEKDWASAAVHGPKYSGDAGLVNRLYFADSSNATQWHIYSVDWKPDSLIFKYDGITMFRVTKPMTAFFGPWAFDNPKYLILNFAVGGIYPFKINGIKEPYYGLSAATLQAIKEGKSRMLVDWVKVSANK
jgi:beta-glucanase (GH16 family)